jgi:ornithine cyclodeaminase
MRWIDAATVTELVSMVDAVNALEAALLAGLDPAADPPRTAVPTEHGQLLLMPAATADGAGVKLLSVVAGNTDRGLPRIQGVYVLMDAVTLTPVALLDGIALTSLRTPAMSALAVRHMASADAARLVVFGTGPQGEGHVEAMRAVRPVEEVVVVARNLDRARAFVDRLVASGLRASIGGSEAVADADLVVCATTSADSLFDGRLVRDTACVVAVGTHEADRRELDATLLGRATVVVEDVSTALREAGDVVLAIAEGAITADGLSTVADVVTGRVSVDVSRPSVYKSVGMAWQDLVVAGEVQRRLSARGQT